MIRISRAQLRIVLFLCTAFCFAATPPPAARKETKRGLIPTLKAPEVFPKTTEVATFAAGCFWGVEDQFRKQEGVLATAVGFMGGHSSHPTYEQVSAGGTGHAESVQVEFDPKKISYEKLLQLFWDIHDPTTKNRQGPDVGENYRSVIFYHSPKQLSEAKASMAKLAASGELKDPIVTEIVPASEFTKADEHHQQYVEKGGIAYCHVRKKH